MDGQDVAAIGSAGSGVPVEAGPAVLARIHGEPLTQLPQDLFIPPHALEVILESFEGPLDLLLYLIRRQNFDILDIPLAEVTRHPIAQLDRALASGAKGRGFESFWVRQQGM